jgi:hypothetical protein
VRAQREVGRWRVASRLLVQLSPHASCCLASGATGMSENGHRIIGRQPPKQALQRAGRATELYERRLTGSQHELPPLARRNLQP